MVFHQMGFLAWGKTLPLACDRYYQNRKGKNSTQLRKLLSEHQVSGSGFMGSPCGGMLLCRGCQGKETAGASLWLEQQQQGRLTDFDTNSIHANAPAFLDIKSETGHKKPPTTSES